MTEGPFPLSFSEVHIPLLSSVCFLYAKSNDRVSLIQCNTKRVKLKSNLLMLFRDKIAIYCDKYIQLLATYCRQIQRVIIHSENLVNLSKHHRPLSILCPCLSVIPLILPTRLSLANTLSVLVLSFCSTWPSPHQWTMHFKNIMYILCINI